MAVASPRRRYYPPLPPLPKGDWPAQGEWTYEDYLRLPDTPGARYELLFGALYMSNTPDLAHQMAVARLDRRVGTFVDDHHLGVFPLAPFEVRLSAIAAPCQPDALFVGADRRGIVKRQFVDGPPDLVVEVLSPTTASVDRRVKLDAYEAAGVLEYWIVNPRARTVEVYSIEEGAYAVREFVAGEQLQSHVIEGLILDVEALFAE